MRMLLYFGVALLITVIVEGSVMYLWSKNKEWMYYSFLANCVTNPWVNMLTQLTYNFTDMGYYGPLAVLEIMAWAAEALIYMRLCGFRKGSALAVSAVLNGLSFIAGVILL